MTILLEHNRLEAWVNETSQYLEEKFPEMDSFALQYIEDDNGAAFLRFDFATSPSPLLVRVVIPTLRERLALASRGSGMLFNTSKDGIAAVALVWQVTDRMTRTCLSRAMLSDLDRANPLPIRASPMYFVVMGHVGFTPQPLGNYLNDECFYPNVAAGPNRRK